MKTVSLVGNILLWILLLPSILFAFLSIFMADAPIMSDLDKKLRYTGISLALYSPFVVLISAIISLLLRKREKYLLSIIFEFIPFVIIITAIMLFVIHSYLICR
jgi:ABC-type transport system involved in multi-copper enzyme maturation permease subunit